MTFCGYNSTIGEALRSLTVGICDELDAKRAPEQTFDDMLDRERIELSVLANRFSSYGSSRIRMYRFLNLFVLEMVEECQRRIKVCRTAGPDLVKDCMQEFINLLEETEHFADRLRSTNREVESFSRAVAEAAIEIDGRELNDEHV